mgnify:CR=1 FL=1
MKKVKVIREKTGEEVMNERMDIIAQNGNDGLHYEADLDAISFITRKYPETTKMFQDMQFEQWELFCKKQMDYGPTNISMGTPLATDSEKRLSLVGLIVRINDKVQRLINLVVKNNREAQNEPTIDAFKDLACYGIIAQIVESGKWGK